MFYFLIISKYKISSPNENVIRVANTSQASSADLRDDEWRIRLKLGETLDILILYAVSLQIQIFVFYHIKSWYLFIV